MTEDKELQAFQAMIKANIARLNDVTQRRTDWMPKLRREAVIERSLEIAWARRETFKPEQECITRWFDRCVMEAKRMIPELTEKKCLQSNKNLVRLYDEPDLTLDELVRESRKHRPLLED